MLDTLKPKAKAVGLGSRGPTGQKIDSLLVYIRNNDIFVG